MIDLIHRKERIIYTAIDVMNELGVQALSTKKIAQYEKISESTIFKHFENKNNILMAVLEFYGQYDHDLFESIKIKEIRGIEGVYYLLGALITYYENYPAVTAITQGIDEMRYIEHLAEKAESIVRERLMCLTDLVKEAQSLGEIDEDIQADIAADLLMGALQATIRRWRMEKFNFSLNERGRTAIDYVIKGLAKS